MRFVKVLGLVTLAAVVVMAFVGAASASAVTLCKENPKEEKKLCPKEFSYPLKTKLSGTLIENAKKEKTKAKGSDGKEFSVECSESEWSGETTTEGKEGLEGILSSYTFGKCTSVFLGACTWVALNMPWTLTITAAGNGNGTYTYTNGGSGVPGYRVTCGTAHCRYGANSIVMSIQGGAPAIGTVNQVLTSQTDSPPNSALCGATFNYSSTYSMTPSPLFIR